jgi:hypothetical protein
MKAPGLIFSLLLILGQKPVFLNRARNVLCIAFDPYRKYKKANEAVSPAAFLVPCVCQ